MKHPIADLHCDLLSYLDMHSNASPLDLHPRCSYPQLKHGNVRFQTMAIFAATGPGSSQKGESQVKHFQELLVKYHPYFEGMNKNPSDRVQIIPAFESASTFCEENEPIEAGIKRLDRFKSILGKILYISLTWDGENRFGGGSGTNIGLKDDGKRLLDWMHANRVACDLSHTSDKLATEIFNYMDRRGLIIPILASHSNFRAISNYPRNLPDDLAKEIIRRKGIIGLNFFAPFVGKDHRNVLRHVEHAMGLKAEKSLCFGADFFCDKDFPSLGKKYNTDLFFFDEIGDASKYQGLLQLFQSELSLTHEKIQDIASNNAMTFFSKTLG